MVNNFKEQFSNYQEYMQAQMGKVANYETFFVFDKANPDDEMSKTDFIRYKSGDMLSEIEFWNGLVKHNKTKKNLMKEIFSKLDKNKEM